MQSSKFKFNLYIMIYNSQKGVSLIIIFLIMTVIIAIVLSISTILSSEIKIIGDIGSSVSSFYAADIGIEKTLYFDRKQVIAGAKRGFCNTCNACNDPSVDPATWCNNCFTTDLDPGPTNGCDLTTCTNCKLDYDTTFSDKKYTVSATVSPDLITPTTSNLNINSKGLYRNVIRQINSFSSSK